jgi:hypothetical protein
MAASFIWTLRTDKPLSLFTSVNQRMILAVVICLIVFVETCLFTFVNQVCCTDRSLRLN